MPRKPRYTKGTSVEPPRQQPPVAPLPSNNGSVSTAAPLRPFQPSRSKPRPEPQTASDSDGIVKQAKMSVRKAMERSLNGKKIVLRFNEDPQAVGDGASLRCSTFKKIAVVIKETFLQQIGSSWKDTRGRLHVSHYKLARTLDWNLDKRPEGIPREYWRWFIDYHNDPATKAKCKQNALNRKKQLYTHIGGSKSLDRAREEEALGKEHSGRVRGIGIRPTPSQLFRPSLHSPVDRAQIEDAQRMLC
ncbi:hypothetical protein Ahy_A09g043493 [Arachis hypogaea]|uniref:Uncharacterized protein n=1 Tax=Arachis hypogaea TaxID=3818 RepID=A0A445BIE4_ARAHY|nr:hypothetical protein Ahy_A09g043493 [Arachis hypogaea]